MIVVVWAISSVQTSPSFIILSLYYFYFILLTRFFRSCTFFVRSISFIYTFFLLVVVNCRWENVISTKKKRIEENCHKWIIVACCLFRFYSLQLLSQSLLHSNSEYHRIVLTIFYFAVSVSVVWSRCVVCTHTSQWIVIAHLFANSRDSIHRFLWIYLKATNKKKKKKRPNKNRKKVVRNCCTFENYEIQSLSETELQRERERKSERRMM